MSAQAFRASLGSGVLPDPGTLVYHDRNYTVFAAMQAHFDTCRRLMTEDEDQSAPRRGREE